MKFFRKKNGREVVKCVAECPITDCYRKTAKNENAVKWKTGIPYIEFDCIYSDFEEKVIEIRKNSKKYIFCRSYIKSGKVHKYKDHELLEDEVLK